MNIKRILVLVLAVLVMAMPLGLAEPAYYSLTLSDFTLDLGMGEPIDIAAAIKLGVGGESLEGPGRLDVEITGGTATAFSATMEASEETLRLLVGGMSHYLEMPMSDFQALLTESAEDSLSSRELEGAQLTDLTGRYIEIYKDMLEKYSDPEEATRQSLEILSVLGAEAKGTEKADIFGQEMELNRFDINLDAAGIGEYYDKIFEMEPALKDFLRDYFAMIGEMSDEEIPFDVDDFGGSLVAAMEEEGLGMELSFVFLTDAETLAETDADVMKMDILVSVINLEAEDDDDLGQIDIPMTFTYLASDEGERVAADMVVTPYEGESATIIFEGEFDVPGEDGSTASQGALQFVFLSEEEGLDMTMIASGASITDANGVVNAAFVLNVGAEDQQMELSVEYGGTAADETLKAGRVTIGFDVPVDEGASFAGSIAFDTLLEISDLAMLSDADLEGMTPVGLDSMDEATMEAIEAELEMVQMQALGVLMQTPGLSNIIGGMMSAAE
jgi:hypothetical protein